MTPVAYLPEARDDIQAAYVWYEQRRPGLGDEFLEKLQEFVERIKDFPEMYAILALNVRAGVLKRFPYVVYYRIESSCLLIIAIQHGSRSSKVWRSRT